MVNYLKRSDKAALAYLYESGDSNLPATVFLGGFRSDMMGTKAEFLKNLCQKEGRAYLRFDYSGHGQSEGEFEELCLSDWFTDVQDILSHVLAGQNYILVGSSMGGWLSLLMLHHYPQNIKGFVGIAAAPDFTQWIENAMTEAQINEMRDTHRILVPNDYGDPYVISQNLIEDGRTRLLLDKKIIFEGFVHLLQGKADTDVPWQTAEKIKAILPISNTVITYREEGNHSLSMPSDLEILAKAVLDIQ